MPGQSYRSKLNPHIEFIREARLREETWEEIARQIGERGTPTDRSQVCKFHRRREAGKRPAGFAPEVAKPPEASPKPEASAPANWADEDLHAPPPRQRLVLKVTKNSS